MDEEVVRTLWFGREVFSVCLIARTKEVGFCESVSSNQVDKLHLLLLACCSAAVQNPFVQRALKQISVPEHLIK